MPTEFSPEAFIEHMDEHNHAPWIRDEAAGVLSLMKRDYMRGFKDSLMQLYDCKPYHRKLRTSQRKKVKTDFRVDDPYLNLFWSTTGAGFGANTEQNDTLSGFLARFIFFFPQGKKERWLPLEEGTALNSDLETVVHDQLLSIRRKVDALTGCTAMHFSPEAAKYYSDWQKETEAYWTATNDGSSMQIYGRLAPTIVKLVMLFELGSPDFDVTRPIRLEFMIEACRLVDSYLMPTAKIVYDLVGANVEKNVIDGIVAYLKNHNGKTTKNEISRDVKVRSKELNEYLNTMEENETIEIKTVKRKGKGRDSVYIVLSKNDNERTKVSKISNIANIAKIAKIEGIPKDGDHKSSTLSSLATLPILPIFATLGDGDGVAAKKEQTGDTIDDALIQAAKHESEKETRDHELMAKYSKKTCLACGKKNWPKAQRYSVL